MTVGEKSSTSPEIWVAEADVFSTYGDHEFFEFVTGALVAHGIDPADVLVCGFDGKKRVEKIVKTPRKTTYAVTPEYWQEQMGLGGLDDPVKYMCEGIEPCLGIYDQRKLVEAKDNDANVFTHQESDNVQAALIGVFVFQKLF